MSSADDPFHKRFLASFPSNAVQTRGAVAYESRLNDLATTIQRDLPLIQRTFPEYTPHDWESHILPLFDLAERLFGADALLGLNNLDRFILAVGIYSHDWGMAVGHEERLAIASGRKRGEGVESELLSDEPLQLATFAQEQGLKLDADGGCPALLDNAAPYWAEYVRRTHAWRSGERVRKFLMVPDHDRALADAGCSVCVGHWLDFDKLRDGRVVRPVRMVGNLRAHVRLVALLVRMIDLFDIGRDRTPYTLRRLIGPSDPTSVKEWDKHDALDPVDCRHIVANRWQVTIRGTCENPALWSALTDLRRYLEDQLQNATALLAEEHAELQTERLESGVLGLWRLDPMLGWDVRAVSFKPVDVRFEFDRASTFRILAQEIYGNEPHVFLRELLQNSIDATRQLCSRLGQSTDRAQATLADHSIRFKTQRDSDGRIVVSCRDFGIGMNEHIVTRFLARVGASYYSSEEFLRDKVPMDAISRFGIGLLSCFMVADKVVIRTKRPAMLGGDAGLIVEILGVDRYFHVYPLDDPHWEGTEVSVEVLPSKLARFAGKKAVQPNFSVINYLEMIAGFVEVPVYVEEDDRRLLILHPKADPTLRPVGVPNDIEVSQIKGTYRWADELQRFKMCPNLGVLSDYRVDVSRDLNLPDVEGFVTFPIPHGLKGDVCIVNNGILQGENMIVQSELGERATDVFAKSLSVSPAYRTASDVDAPGRKKAPSSLLYQDGVYVAGDGEIGQRVGDDPFPPHAWLNYRSSARADLNPSRSSFAGNPRISPGWVVIKARTFAFFKELSEALSLPAIQRLHKLVQLEKYLGVANGSVVENTPWHEFPVIVFQSSGSFKCVLAKEALEGAGFHLAPQAFQTFLSAGPTCDALDDKVGPTAEGYRGRTWLVDFSTHLSANSLVRQSIVMLQHVFLEHALFPVALRFVALPRPFEGPQPQEVRVPRPNPKPENVRSLMAKALDDPVSLSTEEWARLRVANVVDGGSELTRRVFEFPPPFADHFSHGLEYFNLRHPAVEWIVRVAAAATLAGGVTSHHNSPAGRVHNWLGQLRPQAERSYERFQAHWRSVAAYIDQLPGIKDRPVPECPEFDSFISNSLARTRRDVLEQKLNRPAPDFLTLEPWGLDI